MRIFVAVGALFLLISGGLIGFTLGRGGSEPQWLTGYATVRSETRLVSVEVEGWTYGFRGEIPWYDAEGTLHTSGWPECLSDSTTRVTFLATRVEVEDLGKPVLAVDCGR